MKSTVCLAALLAILFCVQVESAVGAATRAGPVSAAMLEGRWIYDAAKSRAFDPDLRITRTATGSLHADGGSSGPYEFDLAGGSYPLSNRGTITWVATGRDTWLATKRRNGDVFETVAVTLSRNTLRSSLRGKLPDGSAYERTVTYRREGRGEGLVGVWRSIKVDTGATQDSFVISTAQDGIVTWRIPTDLQVITGPIDGSDLAIIGPTGPIGSTIAMRAAGSRRFVYVMKNGNRIAERGIVMVSRDCRRLTELSWSVGEPERKSKLVYERDPVTSRPPACTYSTSE
jgi:hypothetical protein